MPGFVWDSSVCVLIADNNINNVSIILFPFIVNGFWFPKKTNNQPHLFYDYRILWTEQIWLWATVPWLMMNDTHPFICNDNPLKLKQTEEYENVWHSYSNWIDFSIREKGLFYTYITTIIFVQWIVVQSIIIVLWLWVSFSIQINKYIKPTHSWIDMVNVFWFLFYVHLD